MENEVWKPVVGFEGIYEVSNKGNVRSLNYENKGKCVLLSFQLSRAGYPRVRLCKDGKRIRYAVHRLVAQAFIPNPNNLPVINHKNEIKTDNRVENLEWCTVLYNNNYGTRNKRLSSSKMENHPKAKAVKMLSKDGCIINVFKSAAEATRFLGKSSSSPIVLVANKYPHCKTAYGYIWEWG